MDVGTVGWPLVQMGWFKPKAGQLPQNRPGPQSVEAEHASRTCQIQFKLKERKPISMDLFL